MYLRPQGDPASRRSRDRAGAVRRRRAVAFVVVVALVTAGIALASSGGGAGTPSLGGPGSASVVGQNAPSPGSSSQAAAFTPARAAVATAARLSLTGQVAQLFLIGLSGASSSSPDVAAFGSANWGGAVLGRTSFVSDSQLGSLAGAIAGLARSAGNVAPLIAAPQEGGPDTAFPDLPPQGEATIGASGSPATARAQALLAGKALRAPAST